MPVDTRDARSVSIPRRIEPKDPASPATTAPMTRRSFMGWMTAGWAAFTATMAFMGTATMRFFFPNVLFEPPTTFEAGLPDEIQNGEVDERFKSSERVWLVRQGSIIYALLAICTHLGCTPNWLPDAQKFKCPCHGSGYYKFGINFEGPTPGLWNG